MTSVVQAYKLCGQRGACTPAVKSCVTYGFYAIDKPNLHFMFFVVAMGLFYWLYVLLKERTSALYAFVLRAASLSESPCRDGTTPSHILF
jgi:hypothetical protein